MFGGVPGKVLDIDKRLLLEKGSDFETLSELPKGLPPHLSTPVRPHLAFAPILPPLASFVPPAFYGPSPFPHPSPSPSVPPYYSLVPPLLTASLDAYPFPSLPPFPFPRAPRRATRSRHTFSLFVWPFAARLVQQSLQ